MVKISKNVVCKTSHPLWMRGLKYGYLPIVVIDKPRRILYGCVDWNDYTLCIGSMFFRVASFMDAWIEISKKKKTVRLPITSHPLWMRGLKLICCSVTLACTHVASFMDAWIEIWCYRWRRILGWRRILYGCVDWNLNCLFGRNEQRSSHPLWMRGLKFFNMKYNSRSTSVASFMDAWIEIVSKTRRS